MARLLLHDSLTTANVVEPLKRGWIETSLGVEFRTDVRAADVGESDFALVPSPEFTLLAASHRILPAVAVVDTQSSAIAMRTPVRPDDIEATDVVLYETSSTAELLARALLWPFFGITVQDWRIEASPDAQITILEGENALRDPESGHTLDLGRSWFVMTGMHVVTHVLVAPIDAPDPDSTDVTDVLASSVTEANLRRRELRLSFDEMYGVERERLVGYLSGQRYRLEEGDREALIALFVRGAGGSTYLPLTRPAFLGDPSPE